MTKSITIAAIIEEAKDTFTYKFNIPKGVTWQAGANGHFVVSDLSGNFQMNKSYVRHLSLMSTPEEGFLGFTTRIKENPSVFKQSLEKYKVGDEMRFFGIKNHIPLERNDSHVVLISMGVGVATFRPMILDFMASQEGIRSITNINIDRSDSFVYQAELAGIALPNYHNKFVSDRSALYNHIQESLDDKNTSYYVVGSDEFLRDTNSFLLQHGVPASKLHIDKHDFKKNAFLTAGVVTSL